MNNNTRLIRVYAMVFILVAFTTSKKIIAQEQKKSKLSVEAMVSMIDKTIDDEFVYEYEKTKYVPPKGKTLLIMGQTVERISEYMAAFPEEEIPSGWSAYWGIPEFKGIIEPHKNTAGNTQYHQMIIDKFPNTVIQSAMWMVGNWDIAKNAGNGAYDNVVKQFSAWAKVANRPIYLRIGYEFDGPHNTLEPDEYVKAYKHIVDIMRTEGAHNVAFVWHSFASKPYKNYPLEAWYPGDDYVDWVAISVFGHAYDGPEFGIYCDNVLNFAKQHKKPVMIAESNPINGIDIENTEVWNNWFANYFSFIYNKNIKAISFINEDWPKIGIEGISEWKDSRLYKNDVISKAWFKETSNDNYLKQSSKLFDILGFEPIHNATKSILKEYDESAKDDLVVKKMDLPFYVYQDGENNPYFPSAYMGNYKAIKVDLKNKEDVYAGTYALKLSYSDDYEWYGLGLVTPPNDWGDIEGGYDLSGTSQFSFWAKASEKNLNATVGFGLIKKDKPYPDSAIEHIEIKLTTKWKKYTIKLKNQDMSCIRSGLVVFSSAYGKPHDIYIDDVVFE
ncbi:glycoside hydrolase family 26 protein [Litoribaculum gwangyangense]|uniref:GH26 domain-containing protein n=1 Tax=Litoribaculum gwangyangense TaxID=1130722 RepID=A0ABP9C515_9FLAO